MGRQGRNGPAFRAGTGTAAVGGIAVLTLRGLLALRERLVRKGVSRIRRIGAWPATSRRPSPPSNCQLARALRSWIGSPCMANVKSGRWKRIRSPSLIIAWALDHFFRSANRQRGNDRPRDASTGRYGSRPTNRDRFRREFPMSRAQRIPTAKTAAALGRLDNMHMICIIGQRMKSNSIQLRLGPIFASTGSIFRMWNRRYATRAASRSRPRFRGRAAVRDLGNGCFGANSGGDPHPARQPNSNHLRAQGQSWREGALPCVKTTIFRKVSAAL